MREGWPFLRDDIRITHIESPLYESIVSQGQGAHFIHEIIYNSKDLPKRIELGDANEYNPYHLFFYMIARFYYFDNSGDIHYYYPNKNNNLLSEKALGLLPSRFKRELVKTPGFEYIEMPGCLWTTHGIQEPWIYSYVRDLYKPIWESTTQVKGKYTYISRNRHSLQNRRVLNESELYAPLKREGFSIYELEKLTFEEQIRLFRSSEFITGLHGAGFAWLIFCLPGTVFCEIDDPNDRHPCYTDIAAKCDLPYFCFVGMECVKNTDFPGARDKDIILNIPLYIKALCDLKRDVLKVE
jgi:hypothetical protein